MKTFVFCILSCSKQSPLTTINHTNLSDQDLLARFYETRDNVWLGVLLERYTLLLYGVSLKYLRNQQEAEDAVQQIFLKSVLELQKYSVTYFSSWIYTIARNYCLMQLRHRQPVHTLPDLVADPADPAQAEQADREKLLVKMEVALSKLNPKQQQCVKLFYLEKKSYQEIVAITGFSLLKVKSYIQNGKRNLRMLIDKGSNL